jgi:hypothetical protein
MKVNILGNVLEGIKGSKDGTCSITSKLLGNRLELCYTCVVHFASESSLRSQVVKESDRAKAMLKDAISTIKTRYGDDSGEKIVLKEIKSHDGIEMLQATRHSDRKICYYRYFTSLEVS